MRHVPRILVSLTVVGGTAFAAEPSPRSLPLPLSRPSAVGTIGEPAAPESIIFPAGEATDITMDPAATAAIPQDFLADLRRVREQVIRDVAALVDALPVADAAQAADLHRRIAECKRAGERRELEIQLGRARRDGHVELAAQLVDLIAAFDAPPAPPVVPASETARTTEVER